ncbi:hypothetical protein DV736_g3390, partial [Chaetothyriales sp. CBS 134916]
MPATYTSYYAISEGNKQAKRASHRSATSPATQNQGRRSSLTKFFNSLRSVDGATAPTGIYTPIIKKGPLFSRRRSAEEQKARDERRLGEGKDIDMTAEMRDMIRAAA